MIWLAGWLDDLYDLMFCKTWWPVWPYDLYDLMTCTNLWSVQPDDLYDPMTCYLMTLWPVRPYDLYALMTCTTIWPVRPYLTWPCMVIENSDMNLWVLVLDFMLMTLPSILSKGEFHVKTIATSFTLMDCLISFSLLFNKHSLIWMQMYSLMIFVFS